MYTHNKGEQDMKITYVFNQWWVVGGKTSIGPYFSRFEVMFVLAEKTLNKRK